VQVQPQGVCAAPPLTRNPYRVWKAHGDNGGGGSNGWRGSRWFALAVAATGAATTVEATDGCGGGH